MFKRDISKYSVKISFFPSGNYNMFIWEIGVQLNYRMSSVHFFINKNNHFCLVGILKMKRNYWHYWHFENIGIIFSQRAFHFHNFCYLSKTFQKLSTRQTNHKKWMKLFGIWFATQLSNMGSNLATRPCKNKVGITFNFF